ncbi:MAG: signal peptidase I [Clostridia bacterium]|nr:signal peptidase I [Clostridia bacterium]
MKAFIFDWLEVLVHAIIAVVICFSFLFRIATIDGPSMENTLHNGERVIISNLFYEPKVGDIVVISRNAENSVYTMNESNTPIIKRIIATEGQTVDIDFEEGIVYVDGIALEEPYTKTPTNRKWDIEFPVTVDEGCIFVLGDNRNDSMDSRDSRIGEYGMIDTRYILGHAIYRVFPFDKIGKIDE